MRRILLRLRAAWMAFCRPQRVVGLMPRDRHDSTLAYLAELESCGIITEQQRSELALVHLRSIYGLPDIGLEES